MNGYALRGLISSRMSCLLLSISGSYVPCQLRIYGNRKMMGAVILQEFLLLLSEHYHSLCKFSLFPSISSSDVFLNTMIYTNIIIISLHVQLDSITFSFCLRDYFSICLPLPHYPSSLPSPPLPYSSATSSSSSSSHSFLTPPSPLLFVSPFPTPFLLSST